MKILVACEESQAVTIELRRLGHEAYSCDLIACSGGHPEWHIQVDALELLKMKWDMIIAFPPCTYLSNAGACRLYPQKGQLDMKRYQKGLQAKAFFLRFLNAACPRVAVENPVSSSVFEMAISALMEHETVSNRNEPLTLDELREMPCEPVYIVAGYVSWWDITSFAGMEYLYLKVEGSLPFRDYGKNWTAYRQKPEEGTV